MGTSFYTRPAQESDRDAVTALLRQNYFGSQDLAAADEKIVQDRVNEQFSASVDDKNPNRMFIGVAGDKPVALAYVVADKKRGGYLIDDLYTQEDYEHQGIGSALLKDCENFAKAKGSKEIHLSLDTAKEGHLVDYYAKRGFLKQTFQAANDGKADAPVTDIDPANKYVATYLMKKSLG